MFITAMAGSYIGTRSLRETTRKGREWHVFDVTPPLTLIYFGVGGVGAECHLAP